MSDAVSLTMGNSSFPSRHRLSCYSYHFSKLFLRKLVILPYLKNCLCNVLITIFYFPPPFVWLYYTVDIPFGQAIQLYIFAINYCFLFFHLYKLLISIFSVNRLIYEAVIFRASFAMSDKNPCGIFSDLQLDGDFVSPYPRPQSKICVLVPIAMVTAWWFFITCFHSKL